MTGLWMRDVLFVITVLLYRVGYAARRRALSTSWSFTWVAEAASISVLIQLVGMKRQVDLK